MGYSSNPIAPNTLLKILKKPKKNFFFCQIPIPFVVLVPNNMRKDTYIAAYNGT